MLSYQYRNSHYEDKTVSRPYPLYNGNPYTGKTSSSYWIDPLELPQSHTRPSPWTSYQIRKIARCACSGNAGNVFSRHWLQRESPVSDRQHASRHVRHARAVMHVRIANPRWRGKRSRHSRRMRNPQFYVSGTRPMLISRQVNEAYNLMVNTEQPVRFGVDTYLAVSASDITDASTQYDEVSLEFQFSTTGEGVLFFRENPATTEVIALYIMANELHFRFATVDESLDIISQAELCAGCWFKVVATRSVSRIRVCWFKFVEHKVSVYNTSLLVQGRSNKVSVWNTSLLFHGRSNKVGV